MNYVSSWVYKNYKVNVKISNIQVIFPFSIFFNDVLINDCCEDTLFYSKKIKIFANFLNININNLKIKSLILEKPLVKIKQLDSNNFNFTFFKNLFVSFDTTSSNNSFFFINIKNIKINDGTYLFNLKDFLDSNKTTSYLIENFYLKIKDFIYDSTNTSFTLSNLSFQEKNRNININIKGHFLYDFNSFKVSNLYLKNNSSYIKFNNLYYAIKPKNKVKVSLKINKSKIYVSDFNWLIDNLIAFSDYYLSIAGEIIWRDNDIKTRNLHIFLNNKEFFNGSLSISNFNEFSDLEKVFFDFNIENFYIKEHDLLFVNRQLNLLPNAYITGIDFIRLKGNIKGFYNDFVGDIFIFSGLGDLYLDSRIINKKLEEKFGLYGNVTTVNFNVGKLLKNEKLFGKITLNSNILLNISKGKFSGNGSVNISEICFNNYNYKNIIINGTFNDNIFDGSININDSSIVLDYNGKIVFAEKNILAHFNTTFKDVKLNNLNFIKSDTSYTISFGIKSELKGQNINKLNGYISFSNVKLKANKEFYKLDDLNIRIENDLETNIININSDFCSVKLLTDLQYENIPAFLLSYINNFLNLDFLRQEKNFYLPNNKFEINSVITEHPIFKFFIPKLTSFGELNFLLKVDNNNFISKVSLDTINYSDFSIKNLNFETKSKFDSLFFSLNFKRLITGNNSFKFLNINGKLNKNNLFVYLNFLPEGEKIKDQELKVEFAVNYMPNLWPVKFNIKPINFFFLNDTLKISDCTFNIDSNKIMIEKFKINFADQYLNVKGIIGSTLDDTLMIDYENLNLSYLNLYKEDLPFSFKGRISGFLNIIRLTKRPILLTNLTIDTLKINDENFGRFEIKTIWDEEIQHINYYINSFRGRIKTIAAIGYYDFDNNIYAEIKLDKWRLNLLQPFVKSFTSEIRGNLSGDLVISGKINKPEINGKLNLVKTAIKMDYLNTRYNFTTDVLVTTNEFVLNNVDVYDSDGNLAKLNGKIVHQNFSNIFVDFNLETKKFMCLNTPMNPNDLYFGTVYTTGNVSIRGYVDNEINISANVETDKGTYFYLNLESTQEISYRPYLKFKDRTNINVDESKYSTENLGMSLNFDIRATPFANIELIFDSRNYDILKAKGTGDLKIILTNTGNFSIYGDYKITEGIYYFSIKNITKKEFNILEGSHIAFNGDPLKAQIDIKTLYRVRTNLVNLMMDSTYYERQNVNCYLNLKGSLTQPIIKPEIEIPNSDSKIEGVLASLSEEEKNKQFISLLVLNNFITPTFYRGGINTFANNPLSENTFEYFSNQISSWLSSLTKDVHLRFSYRPGSLMTNEEIALALSTQIFDNRISVSTNFGMSSNQQTQQSQLIGDFELVAAITKNRKLKLKAYNKTNDKIYHDRSPYTQGLGISYSNDFDSFFDLFKRKKIYKNDKK